MGNGKVSAPDLVGALDGLLCQVDILGAGFAVLVFEKQGHRGGLNGAGDVDMHAANLTGGQRAEGGLILGKLAVVQNSHGNLLKQTHYGGYYNRFCRKRKGGAETFSCQRSLDFLKSALDKLPLLRYTDWVISWTISSAG